MKIYDASSKRELKQVTLYLTPAEAAELADTARSLTNDPAQHHGHVTSADQSHEVTIAVYTPDNLSQFDAESQELLKGERKP